MPKSKIKRPKRQSRKYTQSQKKSANKKIVRTKAIEKVAPVSRGPQPSQHEGLEIVPDARPRTPLNWLMIGLIVLLTSCVTQLVLKTLMPLELRYARDDHEIVDPYVIEFSQYLQPLDVSKITLQPSLEGSWQLEKRAPLSHDKLVFVPKQRFIANTEYRIQLPPAKRALVGTEQFKPIVFRTQKAPGLTKNGLNSLGNEARVPVEYVFQAELKTQNHGLRRMELRTEPSVDVTPTVQDDRMFSWKPNAKLPHDTPIMVTIVDTQNNETLLNKKIITALEPRVAEPVQAQRFMNTDKARIVFADDIVAGQDDKLSFGLPGKGEWIDKRTYQFTPASVEPGKTYNYTVKAGLKGAMGGELMEDYNGTFQTLGAVYVTGASPRGAELSQAFQTISFTFDQPVDHGSAESRFSVSSGTVTGFSWAGNTMRVGVKDLGMQRSVTATVAPGVKNTGFGLPSTQSFSVGFTTEIPVVRLSVPYYRQAYRGSCTAASLKMALGKYGIGASEDTLLAYMGYNEATARVMDTSTNPPTWDDPMEKFVGFVNQSGYQNAAGPDSPPVATAGRNAGAGNTSHVFGIGAGWIAEQIHAGRPVILFGVTGRHASRIISWQTPSGAIRYMNTASHAKVITGVKGMPNDPVGFWINDPLYGQYYRTAAQINAEISQDPYRQAVVVW